MPRSMPSGPRSAAPSSTSSWRPRPAAVRPDDVGRARTSGLTRTAERDGTGGAGPAPGRPSGSVLDFGRHIGWSIGEIARVDPGYLEWLAVSTRGRPVRRRDRRDAQAGRLSTRGLGEHRPPHRPARLPARVVGPGVDSVLGVRSASAPSWTRAVAAARSAPGSRSRSRWAIRSRMRAWAWTTPAPGATAAAASGPACGSAAICASRRSSAWAPTTSSIARIRSTPVEHRAGVPRRDRPHRDVILLVGARRDRIGRGRVGEDLVLRREGGRRVLVDHHPGLHAGCGREERRQAAVEPRRPRAARSVAR